MLDLFERCQVISDQLSEGREKEARDSLIQLLDELESRKLGYSPLVNHLIRTTGLYPYLQPAAAAWFDRFVYESFKADVGSETTVPLHREQSLLLGKLLSGKSLAVSAPTSFGKSFVIDAFISIRKPRTVVIVVPTIALTDETRRRLQRKFSSDYKIITTSDVPLGERNIFVFPQERAISYLPSLTDVDILIVDEFYKASEKFDKERAPSLLRVILRLTEMAKQRYFLAPNISQLNDSPFTKGMEFLELDFHTVFLRKHELYKDIGKDESRKSEALKQILATVRGKSLIYAGSYSSVDAVANLIAANMPTSKTDLLEDFAKLVKCSLQQQLESYRARSPRHRNSHRSTPPRIEPNSGEIVRGRARLTKSDFHFVDSRRRKHERAECCDLEVQERKPKSQRFHI